VDRWKYLFISYNAENNRLSNTDVRAWPVYPVFDRGVRKTRSQAVARIADRTARHSN